MHTTLTPSDLAAGLTMLGLEVESLYGTIPPLDGVIIARVAACESHPTSEHLKICTVETGSEQLRVICGAPNVAVNQLVAFAQPGTRLPTGLRIEKRNILGVESHGMICSEAELGISDAADEILVLNGKAQVGEAFQDILGADTVFEINVTPNRPDCLGIIGIAREIAALDRKPLRVAKPKFREAGESINAMVKITIKDTQACPRYAARLVQNIKVGPSPEWLARRLQAVGIRPISNIVDVTNYVMVETGQPLHAFDFANIQGAHIVVRKAKPGEQFQTLDGKVHELEVDDLLICDAVRPIAIAGVMGGLNSEVTASTKTVVLECAYFDPLGIRKTAKRLGIKSESAHRFERGVDANGIPHALDRATQLILSITSSEAAEGSIDVYPQKIKPATITFRPQRANHVIGKNLRAGELVSIFKRLQFAVAKQRASWKVTVPTFRPDLTREIDLIEEIARVHGYDRIEPALRTEITLQSSRNRREDAAERVRQILTGMGLYEAVTISLMTPRQADLFLSSSAQRLVVQNPLSEDLSTLRPSMLATLLSSAAYNINRKNVDFGLFEIGSVFWRTPAGKISETSRIGAVLSGAVIPQSWRDKSRAFEPADVKGLVETLAERMRLPSPELVVEENVSYLSEGWQVRIAGKQLGIAGQISAACLAAYDINTRIFGLELDFDLLAAHVEWYRKAQVTPRFPAVERDISILVDETVSADRIANVIKQAGGEFLESHALFDVYSGSQVPPGKKSMAYALLFRAPDRTLREHEVDAWQANILQRLEQQVAATLRT